MMEWTKCLWDVEKLQNKSPSFYEIDLTSRCNLNCSWCNSKKERAVPRDMEPLVAKGIINAAYKKRRGILFTGGGEPTLHPEFRKIVALAIECVGVGLTSNGTCPSAIRFFLETYRSHPNSWVRLSLNERPVGPELMRLFQDYPGKIGIVITVEDPLQTYPAEKLGPLAKFVLKREPRTKPHPTMTPDKCEGRYFSRIYEPDVTLAFCCESRGLEGKPPDHCVEGCRWALVDLKKAWEANPFT
jgi:hypothetical protein